MRLYSLCALALVAMTAFDTKAEVLNASQGGFALSNEVFVEAKRADVWRAATGEIGNWWSSAHTISGDAGNMAINAEPQGCFCESLGAGGGVVHMTVTFVNPQVLLRLTGGLGPLGLMGVDGNMVWEFFDEEGGTRVKFSYAVGGYYPDGLDSIAGPVDGVIADALMRLKAYAETGNPEHAE